MAAYSSPSERVFRKQERNRKDYEIMQALREGKRVVIPSPLGLADIISEGQTPTIPPMNDEIMYDHNSMSYKTRFQQIEIDNLNKKIQAKEKEEALKQVEEKMKLENLIAYYYNR